MLICGVCGHTEKTQRNAGSCPECRKLDHTIVSMSYRDDPTASKRLMAWFDRITGVADLKLQLRDARISRDRDYEAMQKQLQGAQVRALQAGNQLRKSEKALAEELFRRDRQCDIHKSLQVKHDLVIKEAEKKEAEAERWYCKSIEREFELKRVNSHLRGQITKLKKKLAASAAAPTKGLPDDHDNKDIRLESSSQSS